MLDSALGWVGQVFEWLGAFVPRWAILDVTEGAIKYVRGQPRYVAPGQIMWWWPVLTKVVPYPVVRQTDRLETQTMVTKDGKTFVVSGTITYSVDDLMLLVPTTHSPIATVTELSMTAIHDVCADMEWTELQTEQRRGTLKTKLKNAAQRQLREYGVRVLELRLNSLATARVIRLLHTTGSEEN
jgi:regulator of protease activity HflC (stomatin/prohibitin superfamily)